MLSAHVVNYIKHNVDTFCIKLSYLSALFSRLYDIYIIQQAKDFNTYIIWIVDGIAIA